MNNHAVSCIGISKQFEQYIFPSTLLQDHILRWRKHRNRWCHKALDNVSIALKKGEWVGLYGPNGCGKTTLLRILAGLLPQDSGTISVDGKLSCFFELGVGFHPERSAVENIYLHGLIHGVDPNIIEAQTDEIIDRAGVASHRDLPIKCYSTGMRMRLAFITTMRTESDIYFLDEILAVGDEEFKKICDEELRELRRKGKTVLLVHHGLFELQQYCNRIVFMESAKVIGEKQMKSDAGTASATPVPAKEYARG